MVSRIGADDSYVHLLQVGRREGQGAAYYLGFRLGLKYRYKFFIQMDADLSHDPSALPRLLAAVESGADIALGSRYLPDSQIRNWALARRLISHFGNRYLRWWSGATIADFTTGFRCIRSDVVRCIDLARKPGIGNVFLIESILRALLDRYDVREVPITYVGRRHGRSKFRWQSLIGALRVAPPYAPVRLRERTRQ